MALPVPVKTYLFTATGYASTVNMQQLSLGAKNDKQRLLLNFVLCLLGFASTTWSVVGCSDSITAGIDATNRWLTVANLVWNSNGSPFSWIVLGNTALGSGWQLLIALNSPDGGTNNAGEGLYVSYSPNAGYTGGSTTARPSATDEVIYYNYDGSRHFVGNDSAFNMRQNVVMSSDGQVTRMFVYANNICFLWWQFEKSANPRASWTYPNFIGLWGGDHGTSQPTYGSILGSARYVSYLGGAGAGFIGTSEATSGGYIGQLQTYQDDLDADYPLSPVALWGVTNGARARRGAIYDLWLGSTSIPDGNGYPATGMDAGSNKLMTVGNFAVPWVGDGTGLVTA